MPLRTNYLINCNAYLETWAANKTKIFVWVIAHKAFFLRCEVPLEKHSWIVICILVRCWSCEQFQFEHSGKSPEKSFPWHGYRHSSTIGWSIEGSGHLEYLWKKCLKIQIRDSGDLYFYKFSSYFFKFFQTIKIFCIGRRKSC